MRRGLEGSLAHWASGPLILGVTLAKEFKTIDELIDLLESRNVITNENTKTQLMRESYYAVVNGYKKPFLDTQAMKESADDIFQKGTRFEWIYSLFLFDRDLRSLTFKYIAKAEAIMKNAVVYSFCKANPGPNDYLATSSYASAKEMLFAKGFSGNRAKIHQTNERAEQKGCGIRRKSLHIALCKPLRGRASMGTRERLDLRPYSPFLSASTPKHPEQCM